MPKNLVIFRKWKATGDIIALFPELPADIHGSYCNSYEHIGQHGGADYFGVIAHTSPVTPVEYARLARELTLIGYRLRPVKRATQQMHERRRHAARRSVQPTSRRTDMPLWEIEQYELHVQTYRIEAETEAEAIKRLFEGEAEALDGGLEYIEVDEDLGLPAEEYRDLSEELRALGASVDEHIIPSIRAIRRLE